MNTGPGWKQLTDVLAAESDRHDIELTQIKEKFGALRVYHKCSPNTPLDVARDFARLIDAAELLSMHICEDCGQPGELTNPNGRWMKTLCTTCHNLRRNPK